MHLEARDFTIYVKNNLPMFFENKSVLDVGSGDINGNNRFLFENCNYQGNDLIQAPNVTVVSRTKDLLFSENTFDVIVSTECFEHDSEYVESFKKIVSMLKDGGLFFFTCASTGRHEHGTRRTSPQDSFGTIGNVKDFTDYYKNLTFSDFNNVVDVAKTFGSFGSYYNQKSNDLYFWGIKGVSTVTIPPYVANSVSLCC
jgi:SAM-dependent methyltransferase